MSARPGREPLSWILWHPHQKLWNWRLQGLLRRLGRPVHASAPLIKLLVLLDSLALLAGVAFQRLREFGPRAVFQLAPPTDRAVLYVDCGLHKEGKELRCMTDWFGARCDLKVLAFEASEEHCRDAARSLADLPNLDLRQCALVGPGAPVEFVKLYKGTGRGRADSLHSPTDSYDMVPAVRLSRVLEAEFAPLLEHGPVLLRMNIEASEFDVIGDLIESGVASRIDGYFGMWDDVAKLDPEKDRRFRTMLRDAGIQTVTFNDRDLAHPLRVRAVRLALDGAVRRGLARKRDRTT